jgi:hypothetical protein
MNQTAVEWLEKEIKKFNTVITTEYLLMLTEQAKGLEKQQIMESYKDSTCQFSVDSRIDCPKSAEQYYNETFKKINYEQ